MGLWRAFGDYVRSLDDPDPVEQLQTEPTYTRGLSQITADMIAWHESGAKDWRTLPAVTGARRLIASTIDQIPVDADGDPGWLRWPRRYGTPMDRGDLIQHAVDSMILHGAAYWVCTWSGSREAPSWRLYSIHPTLVDARHASWGWPVREFVVAGAEQQIPEVPPVFADLREGQRYLLHIPYVVTVDHPEGTSPLIESAAILQGLVDTETHVATLFDSGTYEGGVLSTAHDITVTQATQWQEAWIAARRAHKIPVLGNGLEYRNEVANARDLQLVEARSFNQSVVWALLGIPQSYMGSSLMGGQSSLSYANAQDNRRQFADNCLRAFTTQIQDAVTRLLPMHSEARFDYSEWEGRDDGNQDTEPAGNAAAVAGGA